MPALRRDRSDADTFTALLPSPARAHVAGVPVDCRARCSHPRPSWSTCRPTPSSASATRLPRPPGRAVTSAGPGPRLRWTTRCSAPRRSALPATRAWTFTGRLSLETHAWLRDHAVLDTMSCCPPPASVELALTRGPSRSHCEHRRGADRSQAPLVLPEPRRACGCRSRVEGRGRVGRAHSVVYSRPEAAAEASTARADWTPPCQRRARRRGTGHRWR